jgi:hypothetical protein
MTGIGERHLSDVLDDLDSVYPEADESEAVRHDNRRRLGLVRPKPNRLRGQVVQNIQQTATGFTAIPEAARRELLLAGVSVVGPGGMVRNAAMLGAAPASYTPPTLADMLEAEGGPTLTANAAPRVDSFGMVEGCIAGVVREGLEQRRPGHYVR